MKTIEIKNFCFRTKKEASKAAAGKICKLINDNNAKGQKTVLGLATGSTPVGVYQELIQYYKSGLISFNNVVAFNLDEYYPMNPDSPFSYKRYMQEVFFNHIDIKPENCFIPDGFIDSKDVSSFCRAYEKRIQDEGGIALQLLGIGRTGHIAFNEPGAKMHSETRLVNLHTVTRQDAAAGFGSLDKVPHQALTMGIKTILKAREILLLSFGKEKAAIIDQLINGPVSADVPASFLKLHSNVTCYTDDLCWTKKECYSQNS